MLPSGTLDMDPGIAPPDDTPPYPTKAIHMRATLAQIVLWSFQVLHFGRDDSGCP